MDVLTGKRCERRRGRNIRNEVPVKGVADGLASLRKKAFQDMENMIATPIKGDGN